MKTANNINNNSKQQLEWIVSTNMPIEMNRAIKDGLKDIANKCPNDDTSKKMKLVALRLQNNKSLMDELSISLITKMISLLHSNGAEFPYDKETSKKTKPVKN